MLKRVAIAAVFANGGEVLLLGRAVWRARLCHAPPIAGRAARSLGRAGPRRPDRAVRHARCRRGVDARRPHHRHARRARSSTTSPFGPRGRATPTACCCRTWSPSSTSCSAISASNIGPQRRAAEQRRDRGLSTSGDGSSRSPSSRRSRLVWEILSWIYTVEAQPGEPMVAGWGTLFTHTFLSLVRLLAGRNGRARGRRWRGAQLSRRAALGDLAFARDHRAACERTRRSAACLASRLALRCPGRPGAAGSSNCPRSFCERFRCSRWCRCFSSGSEPISSARSCSSPMASASSSSRASSTRCATCRRSLSTTRARSAPRACSSTEPSSCRRSCPPCARSCCLSLGAGWGAVLAAEYLGAQSGLGYIIVYAQQFGLLDRMFLIAILFILYTSASYWAIQRLFARLLVWAPPRRAHRWTHADSGPVRMFAGRPHASGRTHRDRDDARVSRSHRGPRARASRLRLSRSGRRACCGRARRPDAGGRR